MARPTGKPRLVEVAGNVPPPRRNRDNLVELAYRKIEELLVSCELRPGRYLTMQDLQIAPIDLARERVLLNLRRDIERFVIRLAAERSGPGHRNQFLHMERVLREKRTRITLAEFNAIDRGIDHLVLSTAGEPFLEHTLRPLHTIFRRIGYLHHTHLAGAADLGGTVDHHLAVLNAIANRHVEKAVSASDALMDFVGAMFDRLEQEIDPSLLDSSIEPLIGV